MTTTIAEPWPRATTPFETKPLFVSDLVAQLQALQARHGDLPMYMYNTLTRQSMPMIAACCAVSFNGRTITLSTMTDTVANEMHYDLVMATKGAAIDLGMESVSDALCILELERRIEELERRPDPYLRLVMLENRIEMLEKQKPAIKKPQTAAAVAIRSYLRRCGVSSFNEQCDSLVGVNPSIVAQTLGEYGYGNFTDDEIAAAITTWLEAQP